ncbi:MAG: Na/Pi cotransporter family protein, partial [Trichlorobacter sp.]|nr:Na/Pi cotransporter family protein [Trichlorobacter sp.]
MGIKILIELIGGVALLLWGLQMVNTGIVRAFGASFRRFLGKVLKNRFQSFLAGVGVTAILQSSTATALMLTSFSASGFVELVPALAVMLGANVGTTLIVQILSFDTSAFAPLLLIFGFMVFRQGKRTIYKDLGRVFIGLGLMLFSLRVLVESLAPVETSGTARELFAAMTNDPLLTLLIGTIITWAAHSSVATVLLTMSLAHSALITPVAALALVLGANLGSALNPLLEGLADDNPAHRRMPVGNMVNRVIGCLVFMPFLLPIANLLGNIEPNSSRLIADFHMLFNIIMAIIFIFPLGIIAGLLKKMLPDAKVTNDPSIPVYLDENAIEVPTVALACAARETMRMGDIVDQMFQQTLTAIMTNDRKLVAEISSMDNAVDRLHKAIMLYVVKVTRDRLNETEGRRSMEILSLAINLEHIGDIIDKNLMELANKKIKYQLQFSEEGAEELKEYHKVVGNNLKLAMSIFLSGDVKLAKHLLDEKLRLKKLELKSSEKHVTRLQKGRIESLETSALHL